MTLVTFGLEDAIIATWQGAGSYGDPEDVPNVRMINATVRTLSAEGQGDNRIASLPSLIIAGTTQVQMTSVPFAVLEIIFGIDLITTGVDAAFVETLPILAGHRYPYFGIVGQGLEAEGLGDVLIAANKCKVTSDIKLGSMEYGVISSVEFTATCLGEDDYPIFHLQHRATAGELSLPVGSLS